MLEENKRGGGEGSQTARNAEPELACPPPIGRDTGAPYTSPRVFVRVEKEVEINQLFYARPEGAKKRRDVTKIRHIRSRTTYRRKKKRWFGSRFTDEPPWSPSSGNISQAHAGWKVNGPGVRARVAFGLPSSVSRFNRTAARRAWAIMRAPRIRERSWSRGLWTPWCD
ncbi:hypothetical protein ISCGN_022038 [Ixodes scapularis]